MDVPIQPVSLNSRNRPTKVESVDLPPLPFIRRRLLKPPSPSLIAGRTRSGSVSRPSLSPGCSLVKPFGDTCKEMLIIPLQRLDGKQAPKPGVSLDLKALMKQKVVIKLTRFDGENIDPEQEKPSVRKTITRKGHLFSLKNIKAEAAKKIKVEATEPKHFQRIRKFYEDKNESGGQKKMRLQLRRIDENILFHIKINNPESVLPAIKKEVILTPITNKNKNKSPRRQHWLSIKQEIQNSECLHEYSKKTADVSPPIALNLTSKVNRVLKQLKVKTEIEYVMAPIRVLRKREGRPSYGNERRRYNKSRKV